MSEDPHQRGFSLGENRGSSSNFIPTAKGTRAFNSGEDDTATTFSSPMDSSHGDSITNRVGTSVPSNVRQPEAPRVAGIHQSKEPREFVPLLRLGEKERGNAVPFSPVQNVVSPSIDEAASALFNDKEKERLRKNLIEEQIKQAKYMREHPEINHLMQIAIGKLVKDQPEDPVGYLTSFFADQDLEALESEHKKNNEYLQSVVREKHGELADPTVFSLQ